MARSAGFLFVGLMTLVACGDDTASGGSGAGGSTGGENAGGENLGGGGAPVGGSPEGGAPEGGAAQGGSGGGTGGTGEGGASCDALITQVYADLEEAKACDTTIDVPQCTTIVDGPCCPVAVNPANAEAVEDFQNGMAQLEEHSCKVACPAIPCIDDPVGLCSGNGPNGSCTEVAPQ